MIIGQVEKRSWKVKVLNICIHLILILGSATMVYPLLLMLSGSFKSNVDFSNFTVVPQYLHDDWELFRKHISTKYNGDTTRAFRSFKTPLYTLDTVEIPNDISLVQIKDYELFLKEMRETKGHYWYCIGMAFESGINPLMVRRFRSWLENHPVYGDDAGGIAKLNEEFDLEYNHWSEISLPIESFVARRATVDYSKGFQRLLLEFKESIEDPDLTCIWQNLEGEFISVLRQNIGNDLDVINAKLGTKYNCWSDVVLPATVPTDNPRLAAQWEDFVKTSLNPAFITVDPAKATEQWKKFLLKKYGSYEDMAKVYRIDIADKTHKDLVLPAVAPLSGVTRADWMDFLYGNSTVSGLWINFVKDKYKTVAALNKAWGVTYRSFNQLPALDGFTALPADFPAQAKADYDALLKQIAENKTAEIPADALQINHLALEYRKWLANRFNGDIQKYNEAYERGYKTFGDIKLQENAYGEFNLAASDDWREFVESLPAKDIALNRQALSEYRVNTVKLYTVDGKCDFTKMSNDFDMTITAINEIPAFNAYPDDTVHYTDKVRENYVNLIKSGVMKDMYRVAEPERFQHQWEEFLAKKYNNSIAELNKAWQKSAASFETVNLPILEYEFVQLEKNRGLLIREYLKRNYLMVFETLFLNGNAAVNTVIYCFLAVLAALLVNPLCAYGLSRYKPASSYKILLFLMLPMAFPGMVLGIPQFLLIKEIGLLNTFAALILPGMANGYSIFLLKGFFDSLPKELFESASLDGASEWNIFWNIAMTLSKPILSVIALGAFTGAYANFMLAFLLCQKESMWTMMVYLYQLQQRASQSVGFAALVIAAIPTLLVFIFCQNIIIRGIVVPTEK